MTESAVLEVDAHPQSTNEADQEQASRRITQEELEHYIAELPHIGDGQRKNFRRFSRVILRELGNDGHTHADVPTPTQLVKLKLKLNLTLPTTSGPTDKRSKNALRFFAKFLHSSNRWEDTELTQFAKLMGPMGRARELWPKCEREGCPRRGMNMRRNKAKSLDVKNGGDRRVMIVYFLCVSARPHRPHYEYRGPHGELVESLGSGRGRGGRFRFTDSVTKEIVETNSANARVMADPEVRKKCSESMKRHYQDDPKACGRLGNRSREAWAKNPGRHKRHSERIKQLWAERVALLQAAWRPDDWDHVSIDRRIVGTELLLTPGITNRILGARLDQSRLLKCPYGDSWQEALSGPGRAANYVSEIRKWVRRPGKTALQKPASIT